MVTLEPLTLQTLFERSVATFSERTALKSIDDSVVLSYDAVGERVALLQQLLREACIGTGDRVALYSENMPYWGVVYFAVTTMGAVIVPILPDFHENEVRHIILHAECRTVFVSEKLAEVVDHASLSAIPLFLTTDTLGVNKNLTSPKVYEMLFKTSEKQLDRLKKSARDLTGLNRHKNASEPKEEDLAAIIYTSGTTGSSKGVMLSHRALAFQPQTAQHIVDLFPEDRFLSILPLAHTYECSIGFLVPFFNGSSVTYFNKPPTPRLLVDALAAVRPTCMLSVPLVIEKIFKNRIQPQFSKNLLIRLLYRIGFFRRLLHRLAGKKLLKTFGGHLRFFGIGGAPLSPFVESFLREANFPFCIGYGLTETAPLLAASAPGMTHPHAVGPAIEGVELKIVDQNAHGEGTVYARGPNIMTGYFKDPEKSAEVLTGEGWFNTEDLGFIDANGNLHISGRSKNVILGPSGENIYPEQIEAIIGAHSLVEDVLVFEAGKQLVARIFLNYEKLDEAFGIKAMSERQVHEKIESLLREIKEHANANVSKFSRISRVIEQREPFVKTPTKKIKRYLYTNG